MKIFESNKFLVSFWFYLFFYGLLFKVRSLQDFSMVLLCFFVVGLYRSKKSILEVLGKILLFVIPIEKAIFGYWIPAYQDVHDLYSGLEQVFLGVQIKHFVFIVMIIIYFSHLLFRAEEFNKLKIRYAWGDWFLFGLLIVGGISTFISSNFILSLQGFLYLLFISGIYFLTRFLLAQGFFSPENILGWLAALLVAASLLGLAQVIQGSTLGLFIEARNDISRSGGAFVTDSLSKYRVSSLFTHATYYGVFLSFSVPIIMGIFIFFLERKNFFSSFVFISACLTLGLILLNTFFTLSRSTWISTDLMLLPLVWVLIKKSGWKHLKKILGIHRLKISLLIMTLIGVFLFFNLGERFSSLFYYYQSGNSLGRQELIRQSLSLINLHPWLGIGLNNFQQAAINFGIKDNFKGFVYPVHNMFLLIISEMGVLGGLFFILFFANKYWQIFTDLFNRNKNFKNLNLIKFGVLLGLSAFVINSQYHIVFNQGSVLEIVVIVLALV